MGQSDRRQMKQSTKLQNKTTQSTPLVNLNLKIKQRIYKLFKLARQKFLASYLRFAPLNFESLPILKSPPYNKLYI